MTKQKQGSQIIQFAGYGFGDFGMNLFWNSLSLLLLFWYTNVARIEPATAGLIFFIATAWDAFTDPAMAIAAERTKTRWGSYRPYLIFGGVILGSAFVLLFWVPPLEGIALTITLILSHFLFRTSYTLVGIPYSALTTRITQDSRARTLLSGIRMFFAFSGLMAVSALAFPIVRYFGDGTDTSREGFTAFAMICAVVAMFTYVVAFLSTKEMPLKEKRQTRRLLDYFKDMLSFTRKNPAMHTMLIIIFAHSAANLLFLSTMAFFIDTNASVTLTKEEIIGVNGLTATLMVPVWTFVAHQLGKRKTWVVLGTVVSLTGLHLAVFGPVLFNGFVVQVIIKAACGSGFAIMMWSMLPDIVEYGEWKTGVRSESAAYGVSLFVQKLSIGVSGLAVGLIFQAIGYSPDLSGAAQADVGNQIAILLGLGPATLWFISIWAVLRHPVNAKSHAQAVENIVKTELPKS